jgi:hypothetical protein
MSDDKEKAIEQTQSPRPSAPEVQDELSEADVEKVAGGRPLPTPACFTMKDCCIASTDVIA